MESSGKHEHESCLEQIDVLSIQPYLETVREVRELYVHQESTFDPVAICLEGAMQTLMEEFHPLISIQ